MPNHPTRNDRRKGEERSETLIIPHITKEMVQKAQQMADQGASRAEIEQAIFAMQQAPFQPEVPQTPPPRKGFMGFARREVPAAPIAEPTVSDEPTPAEVAPVEQPPEPTEPETQPEPMQPEAPSAPQTERHAAAPTQPAAPAPKQAVRPAARAPRTYQQAEADLNERIRRDHIWLSNPVMVRGLGLALVIGAALDGKRALMLCVASLILVALTRSPWRSAI